MFLTTDAGYLVPSLVAAMQVYRQVGPEGIADVAVVLVDFAEPDHCWLRDEFPELIFFALSSCEFSLPHDANFNRTHVPRSALARLVAASIFDRRYKNLVYLDGDIQVVGNIRPLVLHNVTKGRLLAAPDDAELSDREVGAYSVRHRIYRARLGIMRASSYFNSGVLAAEVNTWSAFCKSALLFISEHSELCEYHDQSALNGVVGENRDVLSPIFNLTTAYHALGLERSNDIAVLHFTGGQKPWADRNPSMRGRFRGTYRELLRQHPGLERFWAVTSGRNNWDKPQKVPMRPSDLLIWRRPIRAMRAARMIKTRHFAL